MPGVPGYGASPALGNERRSGLHAETLFYVEIDSPLSGFRQALSACGRGARVVGGCGSDVAEDWDKYYHYAKGNDLGGWELRTTKDLALNIAIS